MRFVYFLKIHQMQNPSRLVFAALYLKDQKRPLQCWGLQLLESIYCSRSPLIVASIAIVSQVHVIIVTKLA